MPDERIQDMLVGSIQRICAAILDFRPSIALRNRALDGTVDLILHRYRDTGIRMRIEIAFEAQPLNRAFGPDSIVAVFGKCPDLFLLGITSKIPEIEAVFAGFESEGFPNG